MHVILINASPRNALKSHTAQVVKAFQAGLASEGLSSVIFHLSQRQIWNQILEACMNNENIIIATPVFIETVPGIMIEFLEKLEAKLTQHHKISFIVQSAFPEASQRRCCEKYLTYAISQMNCTFGGILSCGNFFQFPMIEELNKKMLNDFEEFGCKYVENNFCFFFDEAEKYTEKEEITEKEAKTYVRIVNFFFRHISEAQGCQVRLTNKPFPVNKKDESHE